MEHRLRVAPDWCKIKLADNNALFVNVKQQSFSLGPVIALDQLHLTLVSCFFLILQQLLSFKVDFESLKSQIARIESGIKDGIKKEISTTIDPIV